MWEQGKGDKKNDFLPQVGIIKEQKANLDASWNHKGDKYCVGSSSGYIYVGSYFKDNNFWVAHPVSKKPTHKASVVCVRFDPLSGRVVASASLDGTIQITSCYKQDLDNDSAGPFGSVTSHGDTLMSIQNNGWINSVSFNLSGTALCYVTQDCELNFADVSGVANAGGKAKP